MAGCHVQPEQMFNLIWGYNGQYLERVEVANATAGKNVLLGTEVPPGELWVVTGLVARDESNVVTSGAVGVYDGSEYVHAGYTADPARRVPITYSGLLPMVEGDKASATFWGCTLNDDLDLWIVGYKMKLAQ